MFVIANTFKKFPFGEPALSLACYLCCWYTLFSWSRVFSRYNFKIDFCMINTKRLEIIQRLWLMVQKFKWFKSELTWHNVHKGSCGRILSFVADIAYMQAPAVTLNSNRKWLSLRLAYCWGVAECASGLIEKTESLFDVMWWNYLFRVLLKPEF